MLPINPSFIAFLLFCCVVSRVVLRNHKLLFAGSLFSAQTALLLHSDSLPALLGYNAHTLLHSQPVSFIVKGCRNYCHSKVCVGFCYCFSEICKCFPGIYAVFAAYFVNFIFASSNAGKLNTLRFRNQPEPAFPKPSPKSKTRCFIFNTLANCYILPNFSAGLHHVAPFELLRELRFLYRPVPCLLYTSESLS